MVAPHWNGNEAPAEPVAPSSERQGMNSVVPLFEDAALSEDEETGLLDALASLERGEGTDEDEMDARVASVLGL